ncbi:MAG TPA: hypothetical protein VH250_05750 [Granulicella sp.]|jgi:hypothetical protein|nr:hypothetical protein [Granulicella sp.]
MGIEIGVGEDGTDDEAVEQDRAEDVAGEVIIPEVVTREFDGSSDGSLSP